MQTMNGVCDFPRFPRFRGFEAGEKNIMKQWIYDSWNGIMMIQKESPLRHIADPARHMVMQILAFLWWAVFACLYC